MADVVRFRDLPVAAWIVSLAFVHRRWRSRLLSVLAWPCFLLILLPAVVFGGAYWRDRSGVVLVHRWRPVADYALLIGVLAVLIAGAGAMVRLSSWLWPAFLVLMAWFYAGLVVALVVNGFGSALSVVGPGTPKGQRWVIAAMAQRPGTRPTAVLLARDLIRRLPSGAVLLGAAADDDLLRRYLRFGFTEGKRRRVHMQIP